MEATQEIIDHCKVQRPVLDSQGKFMFFSNNKVAQTSINRRAMRDRCMVFKDNNTAYEAHYDTITKEMFESMYKFTIVRNPWSRVVSAFSYLRDKSHSGKVKGIRLKGMSFPDFVLGTLVSVGPSFDPHFDHQYPKAYFNGECFLDFVGKIENLKSDWQEIAKHINGPSSLPHANKSKHKHYSEYYNPKTIKAVQKIYQQDIEAFGYSFGE